MKKSILNVLLITSIIFGLGIFNLIRLDKASASELENRNLKQMPDFTRQNFLTGEFLKDFDAFFSDAFIFRGQFISIAGNVKELYGFGMGESVEIIEYAGANVAQTASKEDADIKTSTETGKQTIRKNEHEDESNNLLETELSESEKDKLEKETGSETENQNPEGNLRRGMLIYGDRAMEVYDFYESPAQNYANTINNYRKLLDGSVKIYSLLAPTQIEFIEDEKYRELSSSQHAAIEYVNSKLDPGIKPINAYDKIEENKDQYLYFRSDHHWTALGAYYAYRSFAEAIGQAPIELNQYRTGYVNGYLGSTYSITLSEKVAANPDKIIYYIPPIDYTYYIYYTEYEKWELLDLTHAKKQNKYRIFLSGDRPLGKIVTNSESDHKILVVKDSYGNAFVPFLVPHYKEIYIVDPRQFELNIIDFINENQINDILFLNYVVITNFTDFHNLIGGMTQK